MGDPVDAPGGDGTLKRKWVAKAYETCRSMKSRSPDNLEGKDLLKAENRRRVWYSIYVLDRLLSLQLGRPPAIHDYDCHVPLPSRTGDSDIDWDGTHLATAEEDSSSTIDYFLALIAFSGIVGHALRDLYGPKRNQRTTDDLCNMLAIKFHHLRALIYRPYLSYPLLRHLDDANVGLMQTDWSVISFYEKRCVMEARETARLMYGISSEEALVHDFPWWQMISSLICSGSILLVSSIFTQPADDTFAEYADALSDDAETCLKVFEALSINSTGARIARNMTERLRECSVKWRQATCTSLPAHSPPNLHGQHISLSEGVVPIPQDWPAEIVDSMAGSAQFSGAVQSGWQL
ncbi:hypothetical protein LRP88_12646 [Fusarium phalaenopsidis]